MSLVPTIADDAKEFWG